MKRFAFALAAIGWLSVPAFAAVANEKPIVVAQMGDTAPGGPGPYDPGPRSGPGYGPGPGSGPGYDRDRGYREGGYVPRPRCRVFRDSYGELHRRCTDY
jgi:hypothetical protein